MPHHQSSRRAFASAALGVLSSLMPAVQARAQCQPIEQAALTGSPETDAEYFGYSVDISKDTIIIGAPKADLGSATDAGKAYIFIRTDEGWIEQAVLQAADAAPKDEFGFSVAIDGNRAVIGAPYCNTPGTDCGAAYIFDRTGAIWTQTAKITASDALANDNFGYAVDVSGNSLVVGAPYDDHSAVLSCGSAYVFIKPSSSSSWSQQQKIPPFINQPGTTLGAAVAILDDTLLTGMPGLAAPSFVSGRAFAFKQMFGEWTKWNVIDGSGGPDDDYAHTLDIDGDLAAAVAYKHVATDFGSASVFWRQFDWGHMADLTASDGQLGDKFGASVAVQDDRILVGAKSADTTGIDSGKMYIYQQGPSFTPSNWIEMFKFYPASIAAGDHFGTTVATSGQTAVCGTHFRNNFEGAAFVFDIDARPYFVQQPLSQTANFLQTVVLSVETEVPATTYQWRRNNSNLSDGVHYSGTNTPMLTISKTMLQHTGEYSVVATNDCGAKQSKRAKLYVAATCYGDVAPWGGDYQINVDDLLAVINSWGLCFGPPSQCPADIAPYGPNQIIDVDDLIAVLNSWGPCN